MPHITLMQDHELAWARAARRDDQGFGCLETSEGALVLEALSVHADIYGAFANVAVEQTFINTFDTHVEATYTFPLPDQGAVIGFALALDGRVVRGELQPRAAARRRYRGALAAGLRAALLEEDRPDVFTLSVGNLTPGTRAQVTLTLTMPLELQRGEATFRFPLVVAPRYVPGAPLKRGGRPPAGQGTAPDTDAAPDASRVTPPVWLPGFAAPVALAISATVHRGTLDIRALRSSLHAVELEGDDQRIALRIAPGDRLDRDFVLRFALAGERVRAGLWVAPDDDGAGGTFMGIVVPPKPDTTARQPRDVVLMLDHSGSMAGWEMHIARRALTRMIDALDADDRFCVILFNSETTALHDSLVSATPAHRRQALRVVQRVSADGGTELAGALDQAIAVLTASPTDATRRARSLALITDAQVANDDQLVRMVRERLGDSTPFHTVGIGSAVNGSLLRRLSEPTGGTWEVVESAARFERVADRLHKTLDPPLMTDLAVAVEGLTLEPDTLTPSGDARPALFHGAPLRVFGRYTGTCAQATLRVIGLDPLGRPAALQAPQATPAPHPGLAPLWARAMIRRLEDQRLHAPDPYTLEGRIVRLSLAHSVPSRFTAYVAIDDVHVRKPSAPLKRVQQPVLKPQGEQTPPSPSTSSTTHTAPAPRGSVSAASIPGGRIGDLLVGDGLITVEQLRHAQDLQQRFGGRLSYHLLHEGALQAQELTSFLSKRYGVPSVDLDDFDIEDVVLELLSKDIAEKHQVIPIHRIGSSLIVAMGDPSNIYAIDELKFVTGFNIEVVVASETAIQHAIDAYYNTSPRGYDAAELPHSEAYADDLSEDPGELYLSELTFDALEPDEDNAPEDPVVVVDNADDEGPVIRLTNLILIDAIKRGATYVHLDVYEKQYIIRYRIDGVLHEIMRPPYKLRDAITARLKIMGQLDIAERRLPQYGRIHLRASGQDLHFALSTVPTRFGERCVLKHLPTTPRVAFDIDALGLPQGALAALRDAATRPGITLVAANYHSGTSTTLYAALSEAAKGRAAASIEIAPSYSLDGVTQCVEQPKIGMNGEAFLHALLEQDIDAIMLYETLDYATTSLLIRAAQRGKTVATAVYTSTATDALMRIVDIGIEPYEIAQNVTLMIAPRMLRRLCPECAEDDPIPEATHRKLQLGPWSPTAPAPKRAVGCAACAEIGYKGVAPIFEVLPMTPGIRDLILNHADARTLRAHAREHEGMTTLREAAAALVREGITSIEELLRCTAPDTT